MKVGLLLFSLSWARHISWRSFYEISQFRVLYYKSVQQSQVLLNHFIRLMWHNFLDHFIPSVISIFKARNIKRDHFTFFFPYGFVLSDSPFPIFLCFDPLFNRSSIKLHLYMIILYNSFFLFFGLWMFVRRMLLLN